MPIGPRRRPQRRAQATHPREPGPPRCVVDRSVLNAETILNMTDPGLSLFAPLCGRNRGAFVLDPPDGRTYGCLDLPPAFAGAVAETSPGSNVTDAESVLRQLRDGNLTSSDAVEILDMLVRAVYNSSADVDKSPYACDASGLAALVCPERTMPIPAGGSIDLPIRAVTLAGMFVPAPWATGGEALTPEQARGFYASDDFEQMAAFGLNAVRVPVPLGAFAPGGDGDVVSALTDVLSLAEGAGLGAILVLADEDKEVGGAALGAAAAYASGRTAVFALTLPSPSPEAVAAARAYATTLPLFLPVNGGDLLDLSNYNDANVFAALDVSHSRTVGDVASSTSADDRMKLFYHESTACIARSPIEYAACQRGVPVFVSGGFDLSIDDCALRGTEEFRDYGQCDRFDETVGSGWWARHRLSFAERQLYSYERGLGWSFAAWKLYGDGEGGGGGGGAAEIASPANLLSLRDVAAAGLFPDLTGRGLTPAQFACLDTPAADFGLGDDTLSPTPGPPPDCGDGWWNSTTLECDYWIPPAPAPAPSCHRSGRAIFVSFLGGAVVALIGVAVASKIRRGKGGYSALP